MSEKAEHSRKLIERISMFNDAVYAIVLTLLVLELKVPEHENFNTPAEMWHGLQHLAPKFLAFLLSIALVGGNWVSSVNIQRMHIGAGTGYIILMITYLSIVSLTPFTCNLIGNYPDNPVSYVVFGAVSMLIMINGYVYLRYCRKHNLYHPSTDMNEVAKLEKNILPVMFFIVAMSAAAFYSTKLSFYLFFVFCLLPFFLTKSLRIHHKEEGHL